jgi:hypothetical protein
MRLPPQPKACSRLLLTCRSHMVDTHILLLNHHSLSVSALQIVALGQKSLLPPHALRSDLPSETSKQESRRATPHEQILAPPYATRSDLPETKLEAEVNLMSILTMSVSFNLVLSLSLYLTYYLGNFCASHGCTVTFDCTYCCAQPLTHECVECPSCHVFIGLTNACHLHQK